MKEINVSWSFLRRRAEQFEAQAAMLVEMVHSSEDRRRGAILRRRAKTLRLLGERMLPG